MCRHMGGYEDDEQDYFNELNTAFSKLMMLCTKL